ncbi:MAG: hypothetical protein CK426_04895 [Legionella sp.]|nr:MAG: hypothetical protein CK423_04260 [Legionella sp.]PJD98825.1 MAG: hypothetical protein CK426_04895 [Legionella sp.]
MPWFTQLGCCIHTSPSNYKVYDNFFFRWLTLDSKVLQTVIHKKKPSHPFLYYLPAMTLMVRSIPAPTCLLGLGGAGLLHMLRPYPVPLTVVEKNKEVIDIAQNYFMLDKLPPFELIHQPAEQYLHTAARSYTHLLVDIYNHQSFPPECSTAAFFQDCHTAIEEHGYLAVNVANAGEQLFLLQLIQNYFNHTLVIPIKNCSNVVIIASKQPGKNLFLDNILLNKEIKKIQWVKDIGYVGTLY